MDLNFEIKLHPEKVLGVDLSNIIDNELVVKQIGLEVCVLDSTPDWDLEKDHQSQ